MYSTILLCTFITGSPIQASIFPDMLVIDIVSHEDFVLTKNVTELQRNINSIIFKLTGIVIEILKNSVIHNIVKTLSVKVGRRKVNKQKFLHLEHSWLASKEIEVTISAA